MRAVNHQVNDSYGHNKVTASLGATVYPIDFEEPEILLKHADDAMYFAKRNGGNRVYIAAHESLDGRKISLAASVTGGAAIGTAAASGQVHHSGKGRINVLQDSPEYRCRETP